MNWTILKWFIWHPWHGSVHYRRRPKASHYPMWIMLLSPLDQQPCQAPWPSPASQHSSGPAFSIGAGPGCRAFHEFLEPFRRSSPTPRLGAATPARDSPSSAASFHTERCEMAARWRETWSGQEAFGDIWWVIWGKTWMKWPWCLLSWAGNPPERNIACSMDAAWIKASWHRANQAGSCQSSFATCGNVATCGTEAMRSGPQWPDLVTISGLEIKLAFAMRFIAWFVLLNSSKVYVLSKALSHSHLMTWQLEVYHKETRKL